MIKKFSILIPSWNNLPYLQLCIESIRRHSAYEHQIIVHINEGRDGSLDWVKAQPDIEYTYTAGNAGVCYALNMSRTLATTDYIVYVNDDMYVCPGWDSALVNEIDSIGHKYFFLSSTAIEPRASSNCAIEYNFGTDAGSLREDELLARYKEFRKEDWQGATWPPNIVHKDVWDLVGGYSIEFSPGMYSDPDFSMKLWQAGVRRFKGLGNSRAYHFGSKSTRQVEKNAGYYTFISKWGITSSTVTDVYLRRGQPFDGPLKDVRLRGGVRFKNLIKRIATSLRPVTTGQFSVPELGSEKLRK